MNTRLRGRIRPWTVVLFLVLLLGIPFLAWLTSTPPWQLSNESSNVHGTSNTATEQDTAKNFTAETVVVENPSVEEHQRQQISQPAIYIHVSGAVHTAGVYFFANEPRLIDAIHAAGGFTDEAEQASTNLARKLSDGEHVHVLTRDEYEEALAGGLKLSEHTATGVPQQSGIDGSGRVNMNHATQAELETLPKIGPALATRIIDWREKHGNFRDLNSLGAVSGIGPNTLSVLGDLVSF